MRAFLFPGQGAQAPGMGKDFCEAFEIARSTFEEADDLLSFNLSKIIFEGPEDLLTETRHSQLAIFVESIALLRVLQQQIPGLLPDVCAGLSLGEYSALHASGRLPFSETLHLVKLRADLMNRACERTQGTMAAVLGLTSLEIESVVAPLTPKHLVWVANFNCPGQTVISGTKEGVEVASAALKAKGARRIIPLQVHGAFHSGLMKMAQEGLSPAIQRTKILESSIGFVMNAPGDYVDGVEAVQQNLIEQVTKSVRWEQGILAMMAKGVNCFLEIGCGKTLTGMNKKIGAGAALSLEKIQDLDEVVRQLENGVCCNS